MSLFPPLGFIFACLILPAPSLGIECFRCNSTHHRECLEKFIRPSTLRPESCSDVFEAKYCVKTTGYYKGEIGDRRFCSARDLGNSCEYILSDDGSGREYRSCVYTCSTDACNDSATPLPPRLLTLLLFFIACLVLRLREDAPGSNRCRFMLQATKTLRTLPQIDSASSSS